MDNVDIIIGSTTDIISEGKIVTGGIDTHVHFINPEQAEVALESGVTTHIGGGTGASEGAKATTVTPGPWYIHRMLEARIYQLMLVSLVKASKPHCIN